MKKTLAPLLLAAAACASLPAHAFTWSDSFVGYRFGTEFHEPNNRNDVRKHILQLTHASGYATGQNFLNLDILKSDDKDPAKNSGNGATELYLTYRHQFHLGKLLDTPMRFGPVKEVAITAGVDLNTKNTRFAPEKRLWVLGPTLKFDVPGFLDLSLLVGRESNHCGLGAPACPNSDITFDPQLILGLAWGIPFEVGTVPLKFQGFLNYNSAKGRDYAGVKTRAETLMRTALMVDVGQMTMSRKNTLLVGVGYEYWRNKFGNHANAAGITKAGIDTNAPTLQLEWHF